MTDQGATGPEATRASVAVALPTGEVRVPLDVRVPDAASATIVVAHGAGAGRRHPFLTGFADALTAEGVASVLFDFPYVVAGRRMPGPAAHAVAAWRAVARWAAGAGLPQPVFAAGKSYGGRMASMAAAEGAIAPAGLVYLGYPLHPPGRPDRLRVEHLPSVVPPQLFVEGTRDPFVEPHAQLLDAVASCRDAAIHWVDGAGHSFEAAGRKRSADQLGAALAPVVAAWIGARA